MPCPRSALLLAAALFLGAASLPDGLQAASVSAPPSLTDLVADAQIVAEFEVLDHHSEMLPDGSIQTRYTFSTVTPMKGRVASIQEVTLPGGVVADRGLYVPGVPILRDGERHILFLTQQSETKPWRMPVRLLDGDYRVLPGNGSSRRVASAALEGGVVRERDYRSFVAAILEEVARQ